MKIYEEDGFYVEKAYDIESLKVAYRVVGFGKLVGFLEDVEIKEDEIRDRLFLPAKAAILNAIKEEK